MERSLKRTERSFPFFAKERYVLRVLFRSLQKNVTFFAFFSVLYKRMLRSFRSFQKNGKERNVLLGLISREKLEKRTEKNVTFSFLNGKDRNVLNGKERGAQPCNYIP